MKKKIDILIIEEYPIIIEAYEKIFSANMKYTIYSEAVGSYGEALLCLEVKEYDVVFINFEIPTSRMEFHFPVERLPFLIQNKFPNTKIVLSISESLSKTRLILKEIPHNALLVKKDINSAMIPTTLDAIISQTTFYSKTVMNLTIESSKQFIALDELDMKILQLLSLGIRTKNLIFHIPLTLSAIEKRKSKIKVLFNTFNDELLLDKARKQGVI